MINDSDILKAKLEEMQDTVGKLDDNNSNVQDNINKINEVLNQIEIQLKKKEDIDFFSSVRRLSNI